jgi:ubiquinone biosynthesis protein
VLQSGEDTRPLVEVYFKTAYKMLFIDGFFHGDLHPGNVLVQEGGRLAIIDCGMVGRLSPSMKDKLIDILWAVMSEDMEALARSS